MNLSICLNQFFNQYLLELKGVSPNTVKTYKDCFSMFLPFAAEQKGIKIQSLKIKHLKPGIIIDFLEHLERERGNTSRTRNLRLAAFKSLARMIKIMQPEHKQSAAKIIAIPQKRAQKKLIGFMNADEITKILNSVDLKKKDGYRDYTLLHLLFNSGARASEVTDLKIDYFDPHSKTLAILGKGNRYRQIELWNKTVELLALYLEKYRKKPQLRYQKYLFINQRGTPLTRHGLRRICMKYLAKALPENRLKNLNPAHSFRHSCAMHMLGCGDKSLTDIKNQLGHENLQSTMTYLHMDLKRCKEAQKRFVEYTEESITVDPKVNDLLDWDNKKEIMKWLDSL